jgi:hypothetical protein
MSNHHPAAESIAGDGLILEYWSDGVYEIPSSKYHNLVRGFRFRVSGVRKKIEAET